MVSIIIPVYNVEKYVGAALMSALEQSYKDIEVIVVDDCGTDGSMKVVEEIAAVNPNVRILLHITTRYIACSRNSCSSMACRTMTGCSALLRNAGINC